MSATGTTGDENVLQNVRQIVPNPSHTPDISIDRTGGSGVIGSVACAHETPKNIEGNVSFTGGKSGEGGIRTLGDPKATPVFETGSNTKSNCPEVEISKLVKSIAGDTSGRRQKSRNK